MTTPPPSPASVIVDTRRSPHARLRPVAASRVALTDHFWRPRRALNRAVLLPGQYALCENTGRLDNLRIAAGLRAGVFQGWFFNDSDVYKWIEAAAWSLADGRDPALEAQIDAVVAIIAAAQQPDGYLNSYFMGERAAQRFTNFDLHEMYCAGHLFQAAIAYRRTTGKDALLGVSIRLADHLCARFGPEETGRQFGIDGHPEVELALVELYRETGFQRYLDLAAYFIEARGHNRLPRPFGFQTSAYHQDHRPFRELERLEGHAVRAVYLNCGAADLYAETGEPALRAALERMWQSMTLRQMHAHGGLGPRYENEGFGADYELTNAHGHAETCAAVANVMWNWRMLLLTGEGRFADVLELALYNSVLSGASLDGAAYFYQNPLRDDGGHRRERWFAVACCPSNLSRTLAGLPGYLYSVAGDEAWVHLYVASQASLPLEDGREVSLTVEADQPWSGAVRVQLDTAGEYGLRLRLPGWCQNAWQLTLNGQPLAAEPPVDGYLRLRRAWAAGDRLALDLDMPARLIESHPLAADNLGRAALMRGPLLYAFESADHPGLDVRRLQLTRTAPWRAEFQPELLGGVVGLSAEALYPADEPDLGWLYRPLPASAPALRPVIARAIPYFAWANRAAGPLEAWPRLAT